jgi:hypothetical protein
MADDPTKKRMARAKQRAQEKLRADGHVVIPSNNDPVCLVAYRLDDNTVRLVRICLDAASPTDRRLMKPYSSPAGISAECWVSRRQAHRFVEVRI